MIYLANPNTESASVNKVLEKLNKSMNPPRVNLPALARRDVPFEANNGVLHRLYICYDIDLKGN